MENKMIHTIEEYANEFRRHIAFGIKSIQAAACIYAEAIRKFPTKGQKYFEDTFKEVSRDTWRVLELIGNGKLVPEAYLMRGTVADRVSKLPIRIQEKIVNSKGVEVVSLRTLKKEQEPTPITDLSIAEAELVIDTSKKRIRTVKEQMELVRKSATSWQTKARRSPHGRWKVEGMKLHVYKPCILTLENLKAFIVEMEKNNDE